MRLILYTQLENSTIGTNKTNFGEFEMNKMPKYKGIYLENARNKLFFNMEKLEKNIVAKRTKPLH